MFELSEKLQSAGLSQSSSKYNNLVEYGSFKPKFYLNPEMSTVLQVKAAEAKLNGDEIVFRFPRIENIRHDKSPQDTTELAEIKEIIEVIE